MSDGEKKPRSKKVLPVVIDPLRLLTFTDASHVLGVDFRSVVDMVGDYGIRTIPVGRMRRIPYLELQRVINAKLDEPRLKALSIIEGGRK